MVTLILGAQWGDEGKGKIVDLLAQKSDFVVRFHGGNNAGHTIVNKYGKFPLHLIPSGIFNPKCVCVIAPGVVVDLEVLKNEIEMLVKIFPDLQKKLVISPRAHVIMPYHKLLDGINEKAKGKGKTGTTGRGIGPVHADKVSYLGIRLSDFLRPQELKTKLEINLKLKNPLLKAFGADQLNAEPVLRNQMELFENIKPYLAETFTLLQKALLRKKHILFEGAQGMFLDNEWGTYPYVTASHIVSGAVTTGAGIAPTKIKEIIAVAKAYTTRVGDGPFPTELTNNIGEKIRKIGSEFGATTGRPRRCGWLDLELLRFTAQINGVSGWALTKLDILDGFKTLKVCIGYKLRGKKISYVDCDAITLAQIKPVYKSLPGWSQKISGVKKWADLPKAAKNYIAFIEKETGVPVKLISVGPERNQTIRR